MSACMSSSRQLALLLPIGLAVAAGIVTAMQPFINARFAAASGARVHGSVLNFAVGLLSMLVVAMVLRSPLPQAEKLATAPWWSWLGGMCGAFFVTMALTLVPKMGAANYLSAMIAGQLLASIIIDHFGLFACPVHLITPGRIVGVLLIAAGVVSIRLW
jgi:transporter family-2 protein